MTGEVAETSDIRDIARCRPIDDFLDISGIRTTTVLVDKVTEEFDF
jgi:hypothetical protein